MTRFFQFTLFPIAAIYAKKCDHKWLYVHNNLENIEHDVSSNSTTCQCDTNSCDDFNVLDLYESLYQENDFFKITSSQNPERDSSEPLRYEPSLGRLENSSSLARVNFTVTSTAKQKILGFGGAMTDSSAIMINQMDENIQNDILAIHSNFRKNPKM